MRVSGVLMCPGDSPTSLKPILLIDDNPLQLKVRETVLRQAGFQVSVATNADSALATLRVLPDRVGLVITDHLMPGCNGSELVRQIRAQHIAVPVIVLSGLAEAEPEYEGLEVSFHVKPFPPTELIALVQSLLDLDGRQRGAA
jgi:DNA-binding response OmpR family regulator